MTRHGGNKSGLVSDTQSMMAFTKGGGGDPSRLGGHVTRTTEYTSNVGNNTMHDGGMLGDRATSAGGGALSFMAPPPGSTPSMHTADRTQTGNHILNYPYSFDQD